MATTAPSTNGVRTTPDEVAEVPITPWTKSGTNAIVPTIAIADRPIRGHARGDDRVAQELERQDRLFAAPLDEHERRQRDERDRERAEYLRRAPRMRARRPRRARAGASSSRSRAASPRAGRAECSRRSVRFGIAIAITAQRGRADGQVDVGTIQRQVVWSTITPPRAGPMIEPAANVAPIRPW